MAYWKFDEGSGTAASDESINNNDGTLSASTGWVTGKSGQAVNFDSINMLVANHSSLQITGDMTISFVINLPDPASYNFNPWAWRKGTKNGDFYCSDSGGGTCEFELRFFPNTNSVAGGYEYNIANSSWGIVGESLSGGSYIEWLSPNADAGIQWGDWHLITIIRNATGGRTLYEDNATSLFTGSAPGTVTASTGDFVLGSFGFGTVVPIDEVRVYNRALSTSEIQEIYASIF